MTDDELKARLQALIDTFVQEERAAVVAFVRGARPDELADAIERGEHRREDGK